MRFTTGLASVLLGAAALLPATASAQTTPERAEAIRAGFKAWLDAQLANANREIEVAVEGGIAVRPAGEVYEMTLGAISLTFLDDVRISWDSIVVDLDPMTNGWYEAHWQLPSKIRFEDLNEGKPPVELNIGSSQGRTVIAPEYETVMSGTIDIADISAQQPDGEGSFSIANISLASRAQEQQPSTGPGIYDSTATLRVDGVSLIGPDGAQMAGLKELAIDFAMEDLDYPRYAALMEQVQAFSTQMQGAMENTTQPPDIQPMLDELGAVMAEGGVPLAGVEASYRISGLTIDADGQKVTVDEAGFAIDLDGLQGEQASIGLGLDFANLLLDPTVPLQEFVPSTIDVDLALTGLPNEALGEALAMFFQQAGAVGPEMAGPMVLGQLQEAIFSSNAAFEIRTLTLDAEVASIDATGRLQPDAQSPFGAIAEATLSITGLDDAQARLSEDPETSDMAPFIAFLASMGEQATDAQGRPARRFQLEMTAEGKLLLNGTDMSPMMQEMMQ